ncbi:MAG TPA: site-specific integrase [Phototrophicaceae bacterium]|nr:site-specific integrase [Phototrophicaceae bacterium]
MANLQPRPPSEIVPGSVGLTFNFALALPGQASSQHTSRAYFRWVDQYLVDVAGWQPSKGDARLDRMQHLPVGVLTTSLTPAQMRAWLGILVRRKHGKQGLQQARASVVTLASLLAEAGWIDDYVSAAISRVKIPRAEEGQRIGHWLSTDQLRLLMNAARQIATSDNQMLRNYALMTMLCTMALRREELASARWEDFSVQNDRAVLLVHGKGRKVAPVDVPRAVLAALTSWRNALLAQDQLKSPATPILRRLWKGGGISKQGLTPTGIWLIVGESARAADLGQVAPHDLRRSVAGALNTSGVPIEKISRLLRHSNVAVTERYLSKLPRANEGAILMSGILGLEDDPFAP